MIEILVGAALIIVFAIALALTFKPRGNSVGKYGKNRYDKLSK